MSFKIFTESTVGGGVKSDLELLLFTLYNLHVTFHPEENIIVNKYGHENHLYFIQREDT